MAATTATVVAEDDTELRDLLVQTLENSGVLNRIKVRRARGESGVHGRSGGSGAGCGDRAPPLSRLQLTVHLRPSLLDFRRAPPIVPCKRCASHRAAD